jgi:uncharacterized protein (TIGR00730 family)
MNITVFGGARPQPGSPAYNEAVKLGSLLGEAGYTVLTGGYSGTMEAVSRGAAESGTHVIGVTCQEIENWRPLGANQWVKEEWRCATLDERVHSLITHCDAALALPGGAGTLTEISFFWNLLIIAALPEKPIILIGKAWQEVFNLLFLAQQDSISDIDRNRLKFCLTVEEAVEKLNNHFETKI